MVLEILLSLPFHALVLKHCDCLQHSDGMERSYEHTNWLNDWTADELTWTVPSRRTTGHHRYHRQEEDHRIFPLQNEKQKMLSKEPFLLYPLSFHPSILSTTPRLNILRLLPLIINSLYTHLIDHLLSEPPSLPLFSLVMVNRVTNTTFFARFSEEMKTRLDVSFELGFRFICSALFIQQHELVSTLFLSRFLLVHLNHA